MDFQDELKRQAALLAQSQAPNLDPNGVQNLGQALTGQPATAPTSLEVKDLGQDPVQEQTLIAKLKALMGQGQ